jgi:tetratricopeptide (TPR) repeat protein
MMGRSIKTAPRPNQGFCWFVPVLVIFAGTAPPALSAEHELPPRLRQVFTEAVSAQKAGQLDVAEKKLLQILSEGGARSYVHHNLGIVYQQRGEHAAAIAQFRSAAQLNPNFVPSRILWGASLVALGRPKEAVRQLERAAKLAPREPLTREQLARAYEVLEDFPGVIAQYRVLRELVPENPEYSFQLGNAYLKYAGWCYEQVLELGPQSARRFQALAETLRIQGRSEQAIRAYERAARADPNLRGTYLALSQLYFERGRMDDALRAIEEELRIAPESVVAAAFKRQIESRRVEP